MIISRSDLIDCERLTFVWVSSSDPDTIGVEILLDGNCLINASMDEHGRMSVLFDTDGGQMEFDLNALRRLLLKCETDLNAWRDRLLEPDGIWERPC